MCTATPAKIDLGQTLSPVSREKATLVIYEYYSIEEMQHRESAIVLKKQISAIKK